MPSIRPRSKRCCGKASSSSGNFRCRSWTNASRPLSKSMPKSLPRTPPSRKSGKICWRSVTTRTCGGRWANTPTTTSPYATAGALDGSSLPVRRAEIRQRRRRQVPRQFDCRWRRRNLWAAVDPIGHGLWPQNDDQDQDELRHHPGDGAPIDVAALDGRWCNSPKIKECKSEWRMHEARLDIGADQHAEPDQVDPELGRDRRQQRDNDESNFEKIEEECDHENEGVDKQEEADLAPRQVAEEVLDPDFAADALEDQAEHARADQDEDHHGGYAHGGAHALIDKGPRQRAV